MDVHVVGRVMRNSLPLNDLPYRTRRFRLIFERGPLFYAEYNIRLLLYLLVNKADVYLANDLDTLAANFIASKLKGVRLVYDSHEYFTEVPELVSRPFIRSIWLRIERVIFPGLKHVMTVNESIAEIYREKYGVPVNVIRNVPFTPDHSMPVESRKKWNLPDDKKIFLFQGAGINIDRGAEEAIDAISKVNDAVLLFIGAGDVINQLKEITALKGLKHKVFFIPKQPMKELIRFTRMADFGLTLDKSTNLNYKYSLPNKLFDYIQANLPVLASDLVEVRGIIEKYDIGVIATSYDTQTIANKMQEMIADANRIARWKKNLNIAAAELCWEKEQDKFLEIFSNVVRS